MTRDPAGRGGSADGEGPGMGDDVVEQVAEWPFADPPDREVIALGRILRAESLAPAAIHDTDDGDKASTIGGVAAGRQA